MPNLNYQFGHKIGVSYYHQIWEGSRHWHSWVESPSAHIHICASMAILGLGNGDRSRMKCELLNWHSYYLQRKIFQTRFKKLVLHFVHLYTHMEQIKLRSLLCPAGSDWNRLKPVEFWSEIFDHSIGQTGGNFSNFSNRIPIGTSGTGRFYQFRVQSIPTGTEWNRSETVGKSHISAYIVGDHLMIF